MKKFKIYSLIFMLIFSISQPTCFAIEGEQSANRPTSNTSGTATKSTSKENSINSPVYIGDDKNNNNPLNNISSPDYVDITFTILDGKGTLGNIENDANNKNINDGGDDDDTDDSDGDDNNDSSNINNNPDGLAVYSEEYNYEEALKESYLVSQLVYPMQGTLRSVLSDDVVKQCATNMCDGSGNIYPINYRDLWCKNDNGDYTLAVEKHLIDMTTNGEGKTLYVKYKVKVGEDPDTGESIYETKYQPVYHVNPYSYYYLTIGLSCNSNASGAFKQNLSTKIQMDQYGNIVLNQGNAGTSSSDTEATLSGGGNAQHYIIIPNFANPDINQDKFFLPSRLYLNAYDSKDLSGILSDYLNDICPFDTFKTRVGEAASPNSIMSFIFPSTTRVNLEQVLQNENIGKFYLSSFTKMPLAYNGHYMTTDYLKFINSKPDDYTDVLDHDSYLVTVFGNNYNRYFLNIFQQDYNNYGNLSEIGHTGLGTNASFAVIPYDINVLYLGPSDKGFREYGIELKGSLGDNCGRWSFLMHNAAMSDAYKLNYTATWGSAMTAQEMAALDYMLGDFTDNIDYSEGEDDESMFNIIANLAVNVKASTDDATSATVDNPSLDDTQKTSTIVDAVYHYLTNVGSSQVAMNTSKISVWYTNLTSQMEENYLFHVRNILHDKMLVSLIYYYILTIMSINLVWLVLRIMSYYSGKGDTLPDFLKKTLLALLISMLPFITVLYYSEVSEWVTTYFFRNTFVMWSLVDLDSVSKQDEIQKAYQQAQVEYFREHHIVDYNNQGIVKIYGDSMGTPDETNDIVSTVESVFLSNKSIPEDITVSNVSLTDMFRTIDRSGNSGGNNESIMCNTMYYGNSIFFYFYDTLRLRYFEYMQSQGLTVDSSFTSENGMTYSWGSVVKMFSDPYFLYGSNYASDLLNGTEHAQDIVGLTNLFSSSSPNSRDVYFDTIESSDWYRLLGSNHVYAYSKFGSNTDEVDTTNPENYADNIIYGSFSPNDAKNRTTFELALQKVNNKCAVDLQVLNDYRRYNDESILFMGALICTMNFNTIMNRELNPKTDLLPVTFESSSYSLDTIFRAMFLESSDEQVKYQGDLMWAVESKGGIIVQILILITSFVGQIGGVINLISVIYIFILACFTFAIAYHVKKDLYNKAWFGLLALMTVLYIIHFIFIIVVRWLCIPATSSIQESLFRGFANGLRVFALLVIIILRIAAICVILIFATKNYRDLGGEVVFEGVKNVTSQISVLRSRGREFYNKTIGSKITSANAILETFANRSNLLSGNTVSDAESSRARDRAEDAVSGDPNTSSDTDVSNNEELDKPATNETNSESTNAGGNTNTESSNEQDNNTTVNNTNVKEDNDNDNYTILPAGQTPSSMSNNSNSTVGGSTTTGSSSNASEVTNDEDSSSNNTQLNGTSASGINTHNSANSNENNSLTSDTNITSEDNHVNNTNNSNSNNLNSSQNISNSTTDENTTNNNNNIINSSTNNSTVNAPLTLQEQLNRLINMDGRTGETHVSVEANNIFSSERTSSER